MAMSLPDFRSLQPSATVGEHWCAIYQTKQQQELVSAAFIAEGLKSHEKVMYFLHEHKQDEVVNFLRASGLFEPDIFLHSGQLSFLTAADIYLVPGGFDSATTIRGLKMLCHKAVHQEGYKRLRALGEMGWGCHNRHPHMHPLDKAAVGADVAPSGGADLTAKLLQYEAELVSVFDDFPLTALCQYNARDFPAEALLSVLTTHPKVVIGTETYENFYYIPPHDQVEPAQRTLTHWVKNLHEKREMERRLGERTALLVETNIRLSKEIVEREKMRKAKEASENGTLAKAEFLGHISHEIRTPLNGILTTAEFLSETPLSSSQKEYVRIIQVSGTHLLTVLNDVLDFSQLEAGKVNLIERPFDMPTSVRDVANVFHRPSNLSVNVDSCLQNVGLMG